MTCCCCCCRWAQVCTLSAGELKSAAAAQLGAWVQQQEDLQLPTTGLDVVQVGGGRELVLLRWSLIMWPEQLVAQQHSWQTQLSEVECSGQGPQFLSPARVPDHLCMFVAAVVCVCLAA